MKANIRAPFTLWPGSINVVVLVTLVIMVFLAVAVVAAAAVVVVVVVVVVAVVRAQGFRGPGVPDPVRRSGSGRFRAFRI